MITRPLGLWNMYVRTHAQLKIKRGLSMKEGIMTSIAAVRRGWLPQLTLLSACGPLSNPTPPEPICHLQDLHVRLHTTPCQHWRRTQHFSWVQRNVGAHISHVTCYTIHVPCWTCIVHCITFIIKYYVPVMSQLPELIMIIRMEMIKVNMYHPSK